jgi:hypothetical protein
MENQINTNEQTTNVNLSETMIDNLKKTGSWMKFFAILDFIFAGLAVIGLIVRILGGGYRFYNFSITAILLDIAMILLLVLIGSNLLEIANGYKQYSITKRDTTLEDTFYLQKKFWKTVGILTIVMLSLLLIFFLMVHRQPYYF